MLAFADPVQNAAELVESRFGALRVGEWFKETRDGAWYLKSRGGVGLYMASGVVGRPQFGPDEVVLVPA